MLRQNNLDDERFSEIAERSRMNAARLLPSWSDFNTHDPGVTLIDLLAFLTESQRFHMEESERADAFFPLLGIASRRVRPATAEVTLPYGATVDIPACTPAMAEEIRFETTEYIPACPGKALSIQLAQRHTIIGGTDGNPLVLTVSNGFPNLRLTMDTLGQKIERLSLAVAQNSDFSDAREWMMVDDFRLSGPADIHFTLEGDTVIFGNGIHGLMPNGSVLLLSMSLTRGADGNITSGQLTEMRVGEHILTLIQEKPAEGGAERESSADTLSRMEIERRQAVTAKDIETLVMETPELDIEAVRVFAPETRLKGERPRMIVVAVKIRGEELTEKQKYAIRVHLEPYRLAGFEFAIRPILPNRRISGRVMV